MMSLVHCFIMNINDNDCVVHWFIMVFNQHDVEFSIKHATIHQKYICLLNIYSSQKKTVHFLYCSIEGIQMICIEIDKLLKSDSDVPVILY